MRCCSYGYRQKAKNLLRSHIQRKRADGRSYQITRELHWYGIITQIFKLLIRSLIGLVVREDEETLEEDQRNFDVYKNFREFYYWNREQIPTDSDKVVAWMDWINISQMVLDDVQIKI